MAKKILITGANGFAGSKIADYFRQKGDQVFELGRRPSASVKNNHEFISFQLGDNPEPATFAGIDILIHCAYDFSINNAVENDRINQQGSIQLLNAARKAGVPKIIFVSSAAAFSGAKSQYGRIKFEIENQVLKWGVLVIRPALIFGKKAGGMVGALDKLVAKFSLLPIVGTANDKLYLCHYQDFIECVYQMTNDAFRADQPVFAANERPLNLKEILIELNRQHHKKVSFIPIPAAIVYYGLKLLEKSGIKSRLRSDSLLGLLNRNPSVDFNATRKLPMSFRAFNHLTANQE